MRMMKMSASFTQVEFISFEPEYQLDIILEEMSKQFPKTIFRVFDCETEGNDWIKHQKIASWLNGVKTVPTEVVA